MSAMMAHFLHKLTGFLCVLVEFKNLPDSLQSVGRAIDISAGGMSFHARQHLEKGSVVLVEPLGTPQLPQVMVKVVRTVQDTSGWLHGCQLALMVNLEELQKWQGTGFRARSLVDACRVI